jgi:hypothetical protein
VLKKKPFMKQEQEVMPQERELKVLSVTGKLDALKI